MTIARIQHICDSKPVHELFDVVCGTSTGGIIALGTCCMGVTIDEMVKTYQQRSGEIFEPSPWLSRKYLEKHKFSQKLWECRINGKTPNAVKIRTLYGIAVATLFFFPA